MYQLRKHTSQVVQMVAYVLLGKLPHSFLLNNYNVLTKESVKKCNYNQDCDAVIEKDKRLQCPHIEGIQCENNNMKKRNTPPSKNENFNDYKTNWNSFREKIEKAFSNVGEVHKAALA
ncbi:hypothetical protein HPP92_015283 [Vanilla planifolia]|uniref:Uncharacterized protein n=1 Tax=Vanilla planifolia TaxID=51239 RepID=A0A835UVN5_VANPL|nr:hypothetical protein HPP92_015283 [Vanilla planifolia]